MAVAVPQALDMLTPLGRGASLLVVGPNDSGKTTLALDAIITQRGSGVKCVLALTRQTDAQLKVRHRRPCQARLDPTRPPTDGCGGGWGMAGALSLRSLKRDRQQPVGACVAGWGRRGEARAV